MVRSRSWLETILQASREGALTLEEISLDRLNYRRAMVSVKKTRNASYVKLLRKLGFVTPQYDSEYDAHIKMKLYIQYLFTRIKQFQGNHKCLWFMLPKIK